MFNYTGTGIKTLRFVSNVILVLGTIAFSLTLISGIVKLNDFVGAFTFFYFAIGQLILTLFFYGAARILAYIGEYVLIKRTLIARENKDVAALNEDPAEQPE